MYNGWGRSIIVLKEIQYFVNVIRNTYPDIIVALDELRVSEQTPLQYGLQESQVDHVEQQQSQDGEVHYDGELKKHSDHWLEYDPNIDNKVI